MGTRAVILAAGQGSRLRPYTDDRPKTLVQLKEKPLLQYILDTVLDSGITEIVIAIGYQGDKIKEFVGDSYKGAAVAYVENPIYDKTNSTYSLWLAKEHVGNDFVVINADTIFNQKILTNILNSPHAITLAVDDTVTSDFRDDAMRVTIRDGLLKNASKQLSDEESHGDAIGMYRFQGAGATQLFTELDNLVEAQIVNQLFTAAVVRVMQQSPVHPVSTEGHAWTEIDTVEDLERAEQEILPKILCSELLIQN